MKPVIGYRVTVLSGVEVALMAFKNLRFAFRDGNFTLLQIERMTNKHEETSEKNSESVGHYKSNGMS